MANIFLIFIGWVILLALPIIWMVFVVRFVWGIYKTFSKSRLGIQNVYGWIKKVLIILLAFLSGIALWTFYLPFFQNYAMNAFSDIVGNELELARHLPKYGYLLSVSTATDLLEDPFKKITQPSYNQIIGDSKKVFLNHAYVVLRVQTTSSMYAGTLAYRIDGGKWFHVDFMTLEGIGRLGSTSGSDQYQTIVLPARSIRIPKEDRTPIVEVRWVRFYKIPKTNIPDRPDFYEK